MHNLTKNGQFPVSWNNHLLLLFIKRRAVLLILACIVWLLFFLLWQWCLNKSLIHRYRHISPCIPAGFMAGTGAQDCGTAMAFMAIQALKLCQPVIIFTSSVYIPGFILKELLWYNCLHLGIYPIKYQAKRLWVRHICLVDVIIKIKKQNY